MFTTNCKYFNSYAQISHISFSLNIKSIHKRCSIKYGVPENLAKFTGKHLSQNLSFNKVVTGLKIVTLWKKRFWHKCVPVNFPKFLRTPYLQNTSGRLLLKNGKHLFSPNLQMAASVFVCDKLLLFALQMYQCPKSKAKSQRNLKVI